MISTYDRAVMFAASAHKGQFRKYTGEPYIEHPKAVAAIVREVMDNDDVLAAAVLHDVIEDCDVSVEELSEEFGPNIAIWVDELSDPVVQGNRMVRKAAARRALGQSSLIVQTIKLADMIDNTKSIHEHDPDFWKLYRVEKLLLLGAMDRGSPILWKRAYDQCVKDIL